MIFIISDLFCLKNTNSQKVANPFKDVTNICKKKLFYEIAFLRNMYINIKSTDYEVLNEENQSALVRKDLT